MARVFLHSGGITPTTVRAGTGGRKSSQWRTQIGPWVPTAPRAAGKAGCERCQADRSLIERAEQVFRVNKQPPLSSSLPVVKGAPGSALRKKALAAQTRSAGCKCKKRAAAEAAKKTVTPKKAAPKAKTTTARSTAAGQPVKATTRTASSRSLGAARRRLGSTDPYQQVLAHDRVMELEQRKKR